METTHCERQNGGETRQRLWWVGLAIIAVGELLKLRALLNPVSGDVSMYLQSTETLLSDVPYAGRLLPYPPYAVLWFLLPLAGTSPQAYSTLFSLQMLGLDILLQVTLLKLALRSPQAHRFLHPALAMLLVYLLGSLGLQNVILERMDLAAACFLAAALHLQAQGDSARAGFLAVFGAGTKVFPGLALPALAVAAWRSRQFPAFCKGACLGVVPALLLAFLFPWWQFAALHAGRGLQVESFPASLIWFLHQFAGVEARWVNLNDWFEIGGPAASLVLPWAMGVWLLATLFSMAVSARAVARAQVPTPQPLLLRAAILPVLGFVAFAPVLSPQFLVWFLPLFAYGVLCGWWREAGLFVVACGLTALVFPTPQYSAGINAFQSVCLLARNLILIALWIISTKELLALSKTKTNHLKE